MERNEGALDRTIRVIIGLVAVYLGFMYSAWWYILAVIALATGIAGKCYLYDLLGIGVTKSKKK